VASDHAGNIVTSTQPTGGARAWRVTRVDPHHVLYGVSCGSTALCVAADSAGNVVTSTNPTGGPSSWKLTSVDSNAFFGVSCGPALCAAADDAGNVVIGSV
jgi:hypothetical protein